MEINFITHCATQGIVLVGLSALDSTGPDK
jgi:hypothetical protein